jgi:hypothetical protein
LKQEQKKEVSEGRRRPVSNKSGFQNRKKKKKESEGRRREGGAGFQNNKYCFCIEKVSKQKRCPWLRSK